MKRKATPKKKPTAKKKSAAAKNVVAFVPGEIDRKRYKEITFKKAGASGVKLAWTIPVDECEKPEEGQKTPPNPPLEKFRSALQAFAAAFSKVCNSVSVKGAQEKNVTVNSLKWSLHNEFDEVVTIGFVVPRNSSIPPLYIDASYPIGQPDKAGQVKLDVTLIKRLAKLSRAVRAEAAQYDNGARAATMSLPGLGAGEDESGGKDGQLEFGKDDEN